MKVITSSLGYSIFLVILCLLFGALMMLYISINSTKFFYTRVSKTVTGVMFAAPVISMAVATLIANRNGVSSLMVLITFELYLFYLFKGTFEDIIRCDFISELREDPAYRITQNLTVTGYYAIIGSGMAMCAILPLEETTEWTVGATTAVIAFLLSVAIALYFHHKLNGMQSPYEDRIPKGEKDWFERPFPENAEEETEKQIY